MANCSIGPTWEHYVGLRTCETSDSADSPLNQGAILRLGWGLAIPNDDSKQIHYLIYYNTSRFSVLENGPKAVTTSTYSSIATFTPGQQYYLMVRATEFDPTEFDITELTQIGTTTYLWPEEISLQEEIIDSYGTYVNVTSTENYPEKGYIVVGSEIMYYTTKTSTYFHVLDAGRGAYNSTIETHSVDEIVKLFVGNSDENSVILISTPSWHNETPYDPASIGEFNVDDDGYRTNATDIVTTDLSAADENNDGFPEYDYCGNYRSNPQDIFRGTECLNSYIGGRNGGFTNFNLQEQNLQRLEMLLTTTGQPAVLLKRKWEGKRCGCLNSEKEHPRNRASPCYSTGYIGGYDRFVNTRSISTSYNNDQGYILVRVSPFPDLLELQQDQGLREKVEIEAWTLAWPSIKMKDVIVLFNEDMSEEFRYYVTSVTRNKLMFGLTGKQSLRLFRIDKTDYLNSYNINI